MTPTKACSELECENKINAMLTKCRLCIRRDQMKDELQEAKRKVIALKGRLNMALNEIEALRARAS